MRKGDAELVELQQKVREDAITQLIRYRKMNNITQGDLAEWTGIQRPNISRMESGQYNPTLDMLVRIADSMGLSLRVVIEKKEEHR